MHVACSALGLTPPKPPFFAQGLSAVGTYWNQDTALQCWQGTHAWLAYGVAIPMLLLYCVGFPLAVVSQRLHFPPGGTPPPPPARGVSAWHPAAAELLELTAPA